MAATSLPVVASVDGCHIFDGEITHFFLVYVSSVELVIGAFDDAKVCHAAWVARVVHIAAFMCQEHLHALLKVMVHLPFPNIFAAWPTPLMPKLLKTAINNSQVYHSGSEAKTVTMTDLPLEFLQSKRDLGRR